jgi:hypothetical protein
MWYIKVCALVPHILFASRLSSCSPSVPSVCLSTAHSFRISSLILFPSPSPLIPLSFSFPFPSPLLHLSFPSPSPNRPLIRYERKTEGIGHIMPTIKGIKREGVGSPLKVRPIRRLSTSQSQSQSQSILARL